MYVAGCFAAFLAIWVAICVARKWYREAFDICAAGAIAGALVLSHLRGLAGNGTGTGRSFFTLTVREFSLAALVPSGPLSFTWRRILVNGSLLPLNYLLEFGFFFLIARYKWHRHRASGEPLSRSDLASTSMLATSVLVCTFLRSNIACNDLGWRGLLMTTNAKPASRSCLSASVAPSTSVMRAGSTL